MAIILPNTRNALGVPNRYSDLSAAGLRWTPPPVYRYDAYDVQCDTATLYEEDIDMDDYQYNVDSFDAAVVPAGYKGVTGSRGPGYQLLIDADDCLCIDDGESPIYPADSGSITGVTQVANPYFFIRDGSLCVYTNPGYTVLDSGGTWSAISFGIYGYTANYIIGIRNGVLVAYNASSGVTVLKGNTGWSISGGVFSSKHSDANGTYSSRYSSLVIDSSSNLYQVAVRYHSDLDYDIELTNLNSSGWQSVSGYMYDNYDSAFYSESFEKRMYGIKNGTLQSIRHTDLPPPISDVSLPASLQITEFSDWWKVVFVAPDEAVAIRRIAL